MKFLKYIYLVLYNRMNIKLKKKYKEYHYYIMIL